MIPQYKGFEKKKFSGAREILPAGGYVGKILKAEVMQYSWGNQLKISFDITEGEFKDFFQRDWDNNTNEDRKWRGVLKLTLPTGDGSEQDGWKVNAINNLTASLEESNPGYNWDWDETKLKGKLMPYLFAQAVKTSATGVPMMRPMVMDYTDDIACRYLDQQYLLGDNLVCAPVFNEEGIANIYLPEGKWYDLITGKTLEGGKYHSIKCSFMEMPVLAKPNSIIAMGNFENQFEYDYAEGAD